MQTQVLKDTNLHTLLTNFRAVRKNELAVRGSVVFNFLGSFQRQNRKIELWNYAFFA